MNHKLMVALATICILFCPSIVHSDDTIKIGVVYAFTGLAQQWSDYGRMGLELARDEINSESGVHGKKIQLIFEDSETEPAKSVSAYRKLVAVNHVKFVFGNVWSFITNPLIPLIERDKVILIAPTVMEESVEQTNPYFYTMGYKVSGLRNAVDKFFKVNFDIKTVGILCWDDMWGQANLKLWQEVIADNKVQIVQEICFNDFNSTLATEVTKIAAKKPDAVIVAFKVEQALARMQEQGFRAKILSTSDTVEAVKVRGATKKLVEGIYFTNWQPTEEFVNKFTTAFGKEPILEAHNHYEMLRSLVIALRENSKDVLSALRKVHYQGVGGEIDFSKGSFVNQGNGELYKIRNGEFELIH